MIDESSLMTHEQFGYRFDSNACFSCGGACCRGESGYIWSKYSEIKDMAEYLDMSMDEFSSQYIKKVKHRYSLIEKKLGENDYACIFFDTDKQQCGIYPVRPSQCRSFPFWDQYRGDDREVRAECPGIV